MAWLSISMARPCSGEICRARKTAVCEAAMPELTRMARWAVGLP